jgi:hypothetical protein
VASPTVYASTRGKAAILDAILEETMSAVRRSRFGDEVIRIAAHGVRVDNERYHNVVQVMTRAAAVDADAADVLARSDAGYRDALGQIARCLRTLKALQRGVTETQTTDILWFFLGHEAWHLLVADCQWSWDDVEQWLTEQAARVLLGDKRQPATPADTRKQKPR